MVKIILRGKREDIEKLLKGEELPVTMKIEIEGEESEGESDWEHILKEYIP